MRGKTLSDSNEALSRKLASLRSLPIKQLKKQWRLLLWLRTAASRQPRAADPCGGISPPGTSLGRTQTIHP